MIIGPAFDSDDIKKIHLITHNIPWIKVIEDVSDMASVFRGAQLAISAGGTTTWELLACGVIPVIIQVAHNQEVVAEGLKTRGLGLNLGWYEDCDWREVAHQVYELLEQPSILSAQASLVRGVVDGRGVWRVIDRILEYV